MRGAPTAARFPRPRGPLLWLIVGLFALWVIHALGVNWLGSRAVAGVADALAGSTRDVAHGQLWRLLTAALVHSPNHPTQVLVTLMLLWFFATTLDETWGSERLMMFLAGSAVLAYALQVAICAVVPSVSPDRWFGAMVMADAATVAWAFGNRHSVVYLFFVVPVRPLVMVGLLAVWHVLLVIAKSPGTEGLVAPFGAMLGGWLFCDSSPLRRWYLQRKLGRLQRKVDGFAAAKKRRRAGGPDLRIIPGGRDDDDEPHILH